MELLTGESLETLITRRERLDFEEAAPIFAGIARALDAVHRKGVIHRDLKPDNVFLVTEDDGTRTAKLLDFGIAKLAASEGHHHRTRTGVPMGTPHYMSPEQCLGEGVDARSDVYAFGVLVFQTLTGQMPFDGDTAMKLLIAHTTIDAPAPSSLAPWLGTAFDTPILAMLKKRPEARPASCGDALARLHEAARASAEGFDDAAPVTRRRLEPGERAINPYAATQAPRGELPAMAEGSTVAPMGSEQLVARPRAPARTSPFAFGQVDVEGLSGRAGTSATGQDASDAAQARMRSLSRVGLVVLVLALTVCLGVLFGWRHGEESVSSRAAPGTSLDSSATNAGASASTVASVGESEPLPALPSAQAAEEPSLTATPSASSAPVPVPNLPLGPRSKGPIESTL